ncbi:hypothetical protein Lspi_1083 [Legionella spiritensis]|uniref:Uncharacterized protein n=1 Tax=Legionella spiritensis TaxID=452 RepID=A0A0W0Z570_LEGSP|nr:hypothetical protein Lspi_1083 [Legionella spiritensis]
MSYILPIPNPLPSLHRRIPCPYNQRLSNRSGQDHSSPHSPGHSLLVVTGRHTNFGYYALQFKIKKKILVLADKIHFFLYFAGFCMS